MRKGILVALAIVGCSKDPAPKQGPRTALTDAGAKHAASPVTEVDLAVSLPVSQDDLVVIGADGALTIAEMPHDAQFTDAGVTLAGLATTPVELAELRATIDQRRAARDAGPPPPEPDEPDDAGADGLPEFHGEADPQLARAQAQEAARMVGVVDPCVHVDEEDSALRGTVVTGPTCFPQAVLVVADPGAPAARLFQVQSVLFATQLGVTIDDGAHLRALAVVFVHGTGDRAGSGGGIVITLAPDQTLAFTDDLAGQPVRLRIDGAITVGKLIETLAAMVAAKVESVLIEATK